MDAKDNFFNDNTDFNEKFIDPEEDLSPVLEGSPTLEEKQEGFLPTLLFPLKFVGKKFSPGSIKGSIFTLMTATLGAGILSLPLAMYNSGLIWSIIIFVFSGVISYYTTFLLVQCSEISGHKTYMNLSKHVFDHLPGNFVFIIIKVCFFLNNFGTVVSYIVLENKLFAKATQFIAGDSAPSWLTDPQGKFWATAFIIIVVYPMTFARTYKSLNFVFIIGVFFMFYVTAIVVSLCFAPSYGDVSSNFDHVKLFDFSGTSKTLGIALFAYACHPNVLDIYMELNRPSRRRMNKVLTRGLFLVFILYMLAGIFGYVTFSQAIGQLTSEDNGGMILLANYDGNVGIKIAILTIALSVLCSIVLVVRPSKDSLLEIFYNEDCHNLRPLYHYIANTGLKFINFSYLCMRSCALIRYSNA